MSYVQNCDQSQEVKDYLINFARSPKGFVVLSGKNGTGKTYIAEAVMADHRKKDHPEFEYSLFIKQAKLNQIWHDDINRWGSTSYLMKKLVFPELLIIDDVGTTTPTAAFMDFLYILVDERHQQKDQKGTIITTNLNAQMMRERFSDAFVSRIASGKCFRFDGKDRRFNDF